MEIGDLASGLTSLTGNAGGLGSSLAHVTANLKAMGLATEDAAGRLRDARGKFISKDQLQAIASGSASAADAMGALGGAAQAAGSKGDALGRVTGALTAGANVAASAIQGLGSAVVAIASGPIPNATQAGQALGQVMGNVITGAADRAAEALGKLGPAGQAAGAALQALGVVAAATVGTLMTLAGVAVDAVQKLDLLRDSFAALAGGAAAGRKLQESLERLDLPFAPDQVRAWAATLEGAGVKGRALEERMKAIAAAQATGAVFGKQWGNAAEEFFKKMGAGGPEADELLKKIQKGGMRGSEVLKNMGLDINALGGQAAVAKMNAEQLNNAVTKALQNRGNVPLEDMALSLPVILAKAKEGILDLFSGLSGPVKALMTEVKSLFGEFSKGGGAAKGLKPLVTEVMSAILGWLKKGVQAAHELVQGFMGTKGAKGPFAEIGAAIHTVWSAVKGLFSALGMLNKGKPSGLSSALSALVFIVKAVAASVGVMIDNATMAIAILSSLGDLASSAGDALSGMADAALSAASNFVAGLVDGISAGASQVIAAVQGLASGALSAFTGALGIHSPSTIMLEHGEENIAGAAATGVEAGTPRVAKAMQKMGESEPGVPKGGKGRGAQGDGGGGGERHYHYHGPMSDYETFKKYVARYWEEKELEAGSAPGPQP